jgi:hypothetical protein
LNQTGPERVACDDDDRDIARGLFGGQPARGEKSHDDVDLESNELRRQSRQSTQLSRGRSKLHHIMLSFLSPELTQAFSQLFQE